MTYQEQAEQEMWEAASNVTAPREYAYDVIVTSTGARCMSTDDLDAAIIRAEQVDGFVVEKETGHDPATYGRGVVGANALREETR